jgi:hypothetical protein
MMDLGLTRKGESLFEKNRVRKVNSAYGSA